MHSCTRLQEDNGNGKSKGKGNGKHSVSPTLERTVMNQTELLIEHLAEARKIQP